MRPTICVLLLLCPLTALADGKHEATKKALAFISAHQRADGSFDHVGIGVDNQYTGIVGVAGLALLSQPGYTTQAGKTLRYLLDQADPEGFLVRRAPSGYHRAALQHGYVLLFLIEALRQHDAGRVKWAAPLVRRTRAVIRRAAAFISTYQMAAGCWTYDPKAVSGLGGHTETATWVGMIEALSVARRVGHEIPEPTMRRAMLYLRGQRRSGGFANGGRGRDGYASPHMTPAALSVLIGLRRPGTEKLIRGAWGYMARRHRDGYLEYFPNGSFAIRRQMYGFFYTALSFHRARHQGFADVHKRMVKTLLSRKYEDGHWHSTIGDVGATAFGVLTLNVAHPKGLIWFAHRRYY